MFSLHQSTNFQKEYKNFQEEIEKIPNEQARLEINGLLLKLNEAVKTLDLQHDFSVNNRLSSLALDKRNDIAGLRKLITLKINEWKISK